MSTALTAKTARGFVRKHGIVLASAKGPAPRLIEAILGEPIAGNWWVHPRAGVIYNILSAVADSEELVVCRLIGGKLTLIHRRLWPALVRAAGRFDPTRLAKVEEEHTPSGKHVHHETPFPEWVPAEVRKAAAKLSEAEAMEELGEVGMAAAEANGKPTRPKAGQKGKGEGRGQGSPGKLVASLGRKFKG